MSFGFSNAPGATYPELLSVKETAEAATGGADALYSSAKLYSVGGYCNHDGKLHRCITDITAPEEWNPAHWEETTVTKELADARDAAEAAAAGTADATAAAAAALKMASGMTEQITSVEQKSGEAVETANAAKQAAENAATAAAKAQETANEVSQALSDLNSTINAMPSQSGTLTFNDSVQSPQWNGLDLEKMTISGQTSGKDADTYTVIITPKEGFKWSDGTTEARSVTWTIGRASVSAPTQSGTLTYNGSEQSPQWNGFDSNKMTMGGTTSGTDAKTYIATATLGKNFQWSDGTTEAKNIAWSIGKKAGSLTLSKASITISAFTAQTITATREGDGTVTATSSNTGVATVSVSGTTITITPKANGAATITVKVGEGTNHTAPSNKTCAVTVDLPKIYGVSWDGTSTTKWTRTDEAAGFTDPVPYKAGMTAAQCSSPFDNRMPWSGMTKSTRTGGVMVAIPKFWYKLTQSGNGIKVQISDKAQTGYSVSPAHMDRGDGKGERNTVYVGRYHCGSDFKSNSGQTPKNNVTRANFRTSIHSLGTNIWQGDFAMRFTLWLLYIVEFADWNSQAKIGKGCGNNSAPQAMGYTDSMPYHTGTTQSSRDTYGLGTQYRNIEGLWDNVYDWADGCYNNSNGMNIIKNPANFSDSSGGTSVGVPSNGWPSKFSVKNVSGLFPMFIPTEASGSETTYSCDNWNFNASGPVVYVGGYYVQNGNHGLFYVGYSSVSNASAYLGSRLQELP